MFLQVVFPVSVLNDVKLQTSQLAALEVFDGDLEWQLLLTAGRESDGHTWYRNRWYPGEFGPPASTEEDRLRFGVEDLVVLGITNTRPDKGYSEDSALYRNYKNLADSIADVMNDGHQIPERAPLFTATLGLANSHLSRGLQKKTPISTGKTTATDNKVANKRTSPVTSR